MSSLRPQFLSISTSKCVVRLLFAFLALALLSTVAMAQDGQRTRGIYPGASYAVSDIDTINTKNGNLMLNIPLASLPPSRGGLSAGVSLVYDSKLFDTNIYFEGRYPDGPLSTELIASTDGGWRYGFQYEFEVVNRYDHYQPSPWCNWADPERRYVWKVRMRFPDGSVHVFRPQGFTDGQGDDYFDIDPGGWLNVVCQGSTPLLSGTMTYYSADGTFMRLDVQHDGDSDASNNPWTLYLPDGGRATGGGGASERIYDRNNNYIEIQSITYNYHPAKKIVDQMNRYIIIEFGPPDYVYAWRNDENGQLTQLTWTITWGGSGGTRSYHINPNDLWMGGGVVGAPGFASVTQIDLPMQSGSLSYKFGYDSNSNWGEVSSVTLPSGAKVNYQYSWDGSTQCYNDAMTSYPAQKSLVYRPEYDLSGSVSNTPCDPQTETCITDTWTYSYSYDQSGAAIAITTGPDGGVNKDYFFGNPTGFPNPPFNPVFKSEHPDGTMIETLWQLNYPYGCNLNRDGVNPYVKTEFVTIKNAAGTYTKTRIKDYNYDKNGNVWRVAEYDWVDYSTVPHNSYGQVTGIPGGAQLKRVTVNAYYNATPDAADHNTDNPNVYHKATSPQFRQATQASEVNANGTNALTRVEYFYDNASTTGNLIQQKSWDSTKGGYSNPLTSGNSISVSTQYNQYGMPTLVTDSGGYQTQMTYGAIGSFSDLYPTQIKTAYQTPTQRTENREYDLIMGLVTRVTDADNNVSTATTYDVFSRPRLVKAAEGKPEETRTATEYSDVNRRVITRSDMNGLGDGKLVSVQHYDQLGRLRLSRQLEDSTTQSATDETQGIKVQTRYKYSGSNSYQVTSHPYREAYSWQVTGAMDWTRSKADNGGKLIEVQKFSGASLPAPWGSNGSGAGQVVTAYDANFITVTDQTGKVRRSMTNSLGQLVRVDEPDANGNLGSNDNPNQPTSYTYDALGNLRLVAQGSQQRFFAYDSLSRLLRARNPEQAVNLNLPALTDPITGNSQWSTGYSYDNNSNLAQKTDARGVVSTYAYDALNRNTSVTFTNDPANTPAVTHTYDGATNGKGKLWKTETNSQALGSRTTIDGYDALGRPLTMRQEFSYVIGDYQAWKSYPVQRTYDRAGHVLAQTYPSGHTVNYVYDLAGRISSFTGNLGEGVARTYANDFLYTETGAIQQEKFGTDTPLYHKQRFNQRGQLWDMRLSTVTDPANWDRGAIVNYYSNNFVQGGTGADNNGNLLRQETYNPGSSFFQDNFTYDSLNRLTSISEKTNGTGNDTLKQTYSYPDRWGNRLIDAANTFGTGINNKQFTIDPATNRLGVPQGQTGAMGYDTAGNLINDSYTGAGGRTFDAENRMVTADTGAHIKGGTFWAIYTYNGDGQRVRRKTTTSYEVWQVYGMDGELVAEYPQTGPSMAIAQPAKEYGYRNGQLLVTAEQYINLAWNKPATQIDDHVSTSTADKAVDGDVDGALWDNYSSATNSHANSWWQVDLQSVQSIDSISVWGRTDCCPGMTSNFYVFVSDNPFTSYDLNTTLNQPGVWNYYVPGYSGTPGSINVNRTGRYVRVQLAGTDYLVLGEVQVWSQAAKVEWMVTDHLGTPRMIVDKTGSTAGMSRHDYLPFGEEIFAGTGGRTSGQGYTANDGVRQQFTQKERDNETGLDYFEVRYYSSSQGRFTSTDEFSGGPDELFDFADDASDNPTFYADLANPQSLNKYQYTYNNPLNLTDEDGHCPLCAMSGTAARAPQGSEQHLDMIQAAMSVIGFVPVIGDGVDLANAAISAARGNKTQAVLDATAALGPLGNVVSGGNRIRKLVKAADNVEHVVEEANAVRRVEGAAARGARNPKVAEKLAEGRAKHAELAAKVKAKPGYRSEPALKDPLTGKTVRPDVVTKSGRPLELKPDTPTGRAAGRRQLPAQERATGRRGRVVYYEPR